MKEKKKRNNKKDENCEGNTKGGKERSGMAWERNANEKDK